MTCKNCNEEYDHSKFEFCPYCLTLNLDVENVSDEKFIDTFSNHTERMEVPESSLLGDSGENCESSEVNEIEMESESVIEISSSEHFGTNEGNNFQLCLIEKTDIPITEVFKGNTFNIFVEYCLSKGIITMGDLESFDFGSIQNLRGIGERKYTKIMSEYKKFIEDEIDENHVLKISSTPKSKFENVNVQNRNLSIEALNILGIGNRTINKLMQSGYKSIADLVEMSESTLKELLRKPNVEKLYLTIDLLKYSLVDLTNQILENEKGSSEYEIFLNRAHGFTLKDIAEDEGVTRERIRQKEAKFFNKIWFFLHELVGSSLEAKGYITVQELLDVFEDEDFGRIMVHACKFSDEIEFLDFADVLVSKATHINAEKKIMLILEEFIEEGTDLIVYQEELEELLADNGFDFLSLGAIKNILRKNKYKVYKNFVTRGRTSYGYLCEKIIFDCFPNGIKLSQKKSNDCKDLKKLREIVLDKYGDLGLPVSDRALSARISDYLVISDRGMAISPRKVQIDMDTLERIKSFIDKLPENTVYYKQLFAEFEGVLNFTSNVNNEHFLHGVLKLFYLEEYTFDRDYLIKNRGGSCSDKGVNQRIKEFIIQCNRPVTHKELKNKLSGFSDVMFLNAISNDSELLQWDYKTYYCGSLLNASEAEVILLRNIIDRLLNRNSGYCSDALLYDITMKEMNEFIDRNVIKKPMNLFYIASYLFEDEYDFKRPHIGLKNHFRSFTTKDIAIQLLNDPDYLSYTEYYDLSKKLQWSSATSSMVFYEIEADYIRISKDKYVHHSKFNFNEETLNEIEEIIRKDISNGYLVISNFSDWQLLPSIRYEWNEFLLESIISWNSPNLRVVQPEVTDRRYQKGIFVDSEFGLITYSGIIAHAMKLAGVSEASERSFYSFLVVNGFARKVIPGELYNSESIVFQKDKFILV
ncbi:helix-hairpin-helix domain-containing protein [Fusibacter sp. JL216-2]|uniref:helix-hairpin-helix domain-containing protein n=1 Tax=Fusibacter sp. JL216-2 TaxID=3071453 RepID=UPI003D341F56